MNANELNPIELKFPGAEVIYNALYSEPDPFCLTQDIAALRLADGTIVDIGWHPQFDPSGSYIVTHYTANFDQIRQVARTRSVPGVIRAVERMLGDPRALTVEASDRSANGERIFRSRFKVSPSTHPVSTLTYA